MPVKIEALPPGLLHQNGLPPLFVHSHYQLSAPNATHPRPSLNQALNKHAVFPGYEPRWQRIAAEHGSISRLLLVVARRSAKEEWYPLLLKSLGILLRPVPLILVVDKPQIANLFDRRCTSWPLTRMRTTLLR